MPDEIHPVGYPFVVALKYDAKNATELSVVPGDQGKVIQLSSDKRGIRVIVVSDVKKRREGWIRRDCARIGTTRKYGDVAIVSDVHVSGLHKIDVVANPSSNNPDKDHPLTAVLAKLISAILQSDIRNSTAKIHVDELKDNVWQAVEAIVGGVRKAPGDFMSLFKTKDFSLMKMCERGMQITANNNTGKRGLYMKVYQMTRGNCFAYVGYSDDLSGRFTSYAVNNESKSHQNIMNEAMKTWMFVLCRLDWTDPTVSRFESGLGPISEQCFILLFQTYFKSLIGGKVPVGEEQPDSSPPQLVGNHYVNAQAAIGFTEVYNKIVAGTCWPGGVLRQSFGATDGCNIASPLSSYSRMRAIWVKTVEKGVVEVYRRSPLICRQSKEGTRIVWVKNHKSAVYGGTGIQFRLGFGGGSYLPGRGPGTKSPAKGDSVSTIIEIAINGQPHPYQYARLPPLATWSDSFEASTVAIRVEWTDPRGTLRTTYAQAHELSHQLRDKDIPGSATAYCNAIGLYRHLKQQSFDPKKSPWVSDFGIARVREAKFDMLTQEISVTELQHDPSNVAKPAKLKPFGVWYKELTNLGADNVGGSPGGDPKQLLVHLMAPEWNRPICWSVNQWNEDMERPYPQWTKLMEQTDPRKAMEGTLKVEDPNIYAFNDLGGDVDD